MIRANKGRRKEDILGEAGTGSAAAVLRNAFLDNVCIVAAVAMASDYGKSQQNLTNNGKTRSHWFQFSLDKIMLEEHHESLVMRFVPTELGTTFVVPHLEVPQWCRRQVPSE